MTTPTDPRPVEPGPPGVLTRDPVRVAWVTYGVVQGIVTVLLLASVIDEVVGGIVTGVALVLYGAVSELFVRPETVPRKPLAELAAAEARPPPSPS